MLRVPTTQQQRVLDSCEDVLVVGRPGTGKTTIGLCKALNFLSSQLLRDYQRVLFISFSNAAVQRIASAARLVLPGEHRGRLRITTFHALCHRILTSHCQLIGLPRAFRLLPPEDVRILKTTCDGPAAVAQLDRLERKANVPFDRFAPLTVRLLRRHEPIRRAYQRTFPLVIVDEYQDTDDDQDELIALLGRQSQLICLGDSEQRIYDFRKGVRADRLERLEASGRFQVVALDGPNYRSGESDLVAVARAVLDGRGSMPKPKDVRVWRFRKKPDLADSLKKAIVSVEKSVRKRLAQPTRRVTVAIMAFRNAFVGTLSGMLRAPSETFPAPFGHQVLVPYESLAIAWRVALTILEHTRGDSAERRAAAVLRTTARLDQYLGRSTALRHARHLLDWADKIDRAAVTGRMKGVQLLISRIRGLGQAWSGDPIRDMGAIRRMLEALPGGHFARLAGVLRLRPPVGPGERATQLLADSFAGTGTYLGATQTGDDIILRERMTEASTRSVRRVLMTLHKCKGKEFDAIVIVEGFGNADRLLLRGESVTNCPRSRRLLSTALTRARHVAFVFTPAWDRCPLLPTFE